MIFYSENRERLKSIRSSGEGLYYRLEEICAAGQNVSFVF